MTAFGRQAMKQRLVAIVDSVVGVHGRADKKSRMQQRIRSVLDVIQGDGIHVVNDDLAVNIVSGNPQVTAVITGNDLMPHLFPLNGTLVELLVKYPVKTEGLLPHSTV